MDKISDAERAVSKTFRKQLWNPFIEAVKSYRLISRGDVITSAVSTDARSVLNAVLLRMLHRISDEPFSLSLYPEKGAEEICSALGITGATGAPSGKLCGFETFDDVTEQALHNVLSGYGFYAVMPKEKTGGAQLIRPLYRTHRSDIDAWASSVGLAVRCPSPVYGDAAELIGELEKGSPNVGKCIFGSLHNGWPDTFPRYTEDGVNRSFLEKYDDKRSDTMNKTVQVAAALITDGERFLICRRPPEKARGLLWEFVGGKREKGETLDQTLIRECREELGVTVEPYAVYTRLTHEYPDLTVDLTLFSARITEGEPTLLEHTALAWIKPEEAHDYEFCPADESILTLIKERGL